MLCHYTVNASCGNKLLQTAEGITLVFCYPHRPSDPFLMSPDGGVGSPPPAGSLFSPHLDVTLLGSLAAKRDSTYSSMSEGSASPGHSARVSHAGLLSQGESRRVH